KSKNEIPFSEVDKAIGNKAKGKAEIIDEIVMALNDAGIDVLDAPGSAGKRKKAALGDDDLLPEAAEIDDDSTDSDDGEEEKTEVVADTSDAGLGKSSDTVRIYLRQMGSRKLLSREEEVELAKQIELEENRILSRL